MSALADVRMVARFVGGLRPFLRAATTTTPVARREVAAALAARERNFLSLLEHGVFANPRSPYRRLLAHAGCSLADAREMIRARGLAETLAELGRAGVSVAFEEFKGYQPVRRGSLVFQPAARDFDNPLTKRAYLGRTGASTGVGTRVWLDLDHLAAQAAHTRLAFAAHGLEGAALALWRGVLPSAAGINFLLRTLRAGLRLERWFTPVGGGEFAQRRYRIATRALVAMIRALGGAAPRPEVVPIDEPSTVARWAADRASSERPVVVNTTASSAVRVAAASQEIARPLAGVSFWVGGEPLTEAKAEAIGRSGARALPTYNFVESGFVAAPCARPSDPSDVHLLRDVLELDVVSRQVPGAPAPVPALRFTSLRLTAPKILLNTESDDFATVERRTCGCPLEELGYDVHLRQIFSFRKLTGEGVTLVGSEMTRILEETLPRTFGGAPTDYQLLEEEQADGTTRLFVIVDPRVALADEDRVVEVVLDALRERPGGAGLSAAIWRQARSLAVRRARPAATAGGKLLPLHVGRAARAPSAQS
jgi:hypothetical protein